MRCFSFALLIAGLFQFVSVKAQESTTEPGFPALDTALIGYHSSFERECFADLYTDKEVDFLVFFIAADKTQTKEDYLRIKEKLDAFCASTLKSGLMEKPPKKQLKTLYKQVHGTYLDKYELENNFSAIFQDGRYNCVSGSALYASIFTCVGIPFAIQEYPTHVNLVAYPNGEQIAVETTDPATGYMVISDKMKREYADYLRDNKLISEAEYNQGPEAVFQANYFDSEVIDFRQLAGIQYYNNALYASEREENLTAMDLAVKAYVLYPTDITLFALLSATTFCIENNIGDAKERIKEYELAAHFLENGIDGEYLIGQFEAVAIDHMIAKRDTSLFSAIYRGLQKSASDSLFKHDAELIYNYQMARYFTMLGNTEQTMPYVLRAYELDATNLEVEALTVASLADWVKYESMEASITMMDSVLVRYPALKQNRNVESWQANAYLEYFGVNYRDGQPQTAEKYRARFEEMAKSKSLSELGVSVRLFEAAYHEGVVYYFKRSKYKQVDDLLAAALSIEPNNRHIADLKRRYH